MGWLLVTKGPSSPKLLSSGSHDGGRLRVDRARKELLGRTSGRDSDANGEKCLQVRAGEGLEPYQTFPTSGHRKGGDAGIGSWLVG